MCCNIMSTVTVNSEETLDSTWKILLGAFERGLTEKPTTSRRPSRSYEQYVAELQANKRKQRQERELDNNNEEKVNHTEGNQIHVLGNWMSDDDVAEICDNENITADDDVNRNVTKGKRRNNVNNKRQSIKRYSKSGQAFINCGESSTTDGEEGATIKAEAENLHVFSQEESDWESLYSSLSGDEQQTFDDFSKTCTADEYAGKDDATEDLSFYLPYSDLTDCILEQYYPQSAYVRQRRAKKMGEYDYEQEFSKYGQLSLEERLPMMQVIDALDEMNKVLKVGKITTRLERIIEYNQDYPFAEGYQEEELGWCPWLVYKIERLCKRISAKQWPY